MSTVVLGKFKHACLLSFCAFVALTWGNANAAYLNVTDYSATVKVSSGGLNVRETANWGTVVGKVYNGTAVRVLAHDGIWRQLYYSGKVQGWVSGSYLSTSSSSTTKCYGNNCLKKDPASMGCSAASTRTTDYLGGHLTQYSHKMEVRFSKDCRATWLRYRNTSFSRDWAWIFSSNSKYYLDTDNMAAGIKSGRVQVDGFPIGGREWQDFATRPGDKGPTFWSTLVTHPYVRVCVNWRSTNFRSGDSVPFAQNCSSWHTYRNPYVPVGSER